MSSFHSYQEVVIVELEKLGFDKLVEFYQPPTVELAVFIHAQIALYHFTDLEPSLCAERILNAFNRIQESIIPSKTI